MSQAALGFWKVTTQGDVEGRTTKDLGVHYGYLDDIAFALAPECYYDLKFTPVDPYARSSQAPTASSVSIRLESTDWSTERRFQAMQDLLQGRDVDLKLDPGGDTAKLTKKASEEELALAKREAAKNRLQKKLENLLSAEELELLGDMDA